MGSSQSQPEKAARAPAGPVRLLGKTEEEMLTWIKELPYNSRGLARHIYDRVLSPRLLGSPPGRGHRTPRPARACRAVSPGAS